MNLVFWLSELSIHFSSFLRSLADIGHAVTVVSLSELSQPRKELGWGIPNFGKCKLVQVKTIQEIQNIITSHSNDCIHITTGFRTFFDRMVVKECLNYKVRLGFHVESPHPDNFMVIFKWIYYSYALKRLHPHIDFICALGQLGVKWYRSCGFPNDSLFPIAYAVEDYRMNFTNHSIIHKKENITRVIYLGRFLPIKRGDLLLNALHSARDLEWTCDFVGIGNMEVPWKKQCQSLNLQHRVSFKSPISYDRVIGLLANYDVLVLPSAHEGWGAVVNEALMAGVPVICSSSCGAADLICKPWLGTVFNSNSTHSLSKALRFWIQYCPLPIESRVRITHTAKLINGLNIAKYFSAILDNVYSTGTRPSPPWIFT